MKILDQIMSATSSVSIWGGILLFILTLLYLAMKRDIYKYDKISYLFTPAEEKFLSVLEKAVGSRYRVYGKIRIADVVKPNKSLSKRLWEKQFYRISNKHFDYVLCSNDKIEPLLAIELNDSSHSRSDRRERDVEVGKICKSARLPILWIPIANKYSAEKISEQIEKILADTD